MRPHSPAIHTSQVDKINAIKANDDAALKDLYQSNYGKVERYIIDNNGSAEHAKDIYQEAFIAVWRNIQLDKFQPENNTALEGYLYQIAKNKWTDYLRSSHYKKTADIDIIEPGLRADELPDDESDYILAVKNNFKHLGDNCKEVLTKFYYEKETMKEIAEKFNWTEATARNNKYRCLQRLRELLKTK